MYNINRELSRYPFRFDLIFFLSNLATFYYISEYTIFKQN